MRIRTLVYEKKNIVVNRLHQLTPSNLDTLTKKVENLKAGFINQDTNAQFISQKQLGGGGIFTYELRLQILIHLRNPLVGEGELFVTYELPPSIYIYPLHQNTTSHLDTFAKKSI